MHVIYALPRLASKRLQDTCRCKVLPKNQTRIGVDGVILKHNKHYTSHKPHDYVIVKNISQRKLILFLKKNLVLQHALVHSPYA